MERLLPQVCPQAGASLKVDALLAQPLAVQRRLLRAALEGAGAGFDFRHGEQILGLAQKTRGAVELPGGWRVVLGKGELRIEQRAENAPAAASPARAQRGAQGSGRKGGVRV